MENKVTKLILNGKEYLITDKQAQQILNILTNDVEQLKKDVAELNTTLTWRYID